MTESTLPRTNTHTQTQTLCSLLSPRWMRTSPQSSQSVRDEFCVIHCDQMRVCDLGGAVWQSFPVGFVLAPLFPRSVAPLVPFRHPPRSVPSAPVLSRWGLSSLPSRSPRSVPSPVGSVRSFVPLSPPCPFRSVPLVCSPPPPLPSSLLSFRSAPRFPRPFSFPRSPNSTISFPSLPALFVSLSARTSDSPARSCDTVFLPSRYNV